MLQAFVITVTTGFDGSTLFGPPDPSPQATPETGVIEFTVASAGILDPATLVRYVGRGGWLLAGIGLTIQQGAVVQVGLVQPVTFSSEQEIIDNLPLGFAPSYRYRPTYVPAGWRLRFQKFDEDPTPAVIRLDICPLRDAKLAQRAIAATRLYELVPVQT